MKIKGILFLELLLLGIVIWLWPNQTKALVPVCEIGDTSTWSCGSGGCLPTERRHCLCGSDYQWGPCYCIDSSDSCSSGTCIDGQTGGCGTNGCSSAETSTCVGGNWSCTASASCSSGGSGCVPSNPTQFWLSAPANNTISPVNDVYLDWTNVGSWGIGCPQNNRYRVKYVQVPSLASPCPAQGNAAYTGVNVGTSSNYQVNNLAWGSTYCWYVTAQNGSNSKDSNQTWKFQIYKRPTYVSSGISSAQTCGGGVFGNPSISGTDNPVTFYTEYSLNDNGVGREGITQIALSLVPDIYANANIVSEAVLAGTTKNYFMAIVSLNHSNLNNSSFQIVNTNTSPYYSSGVTTGNLKNTQGTATLMNINDLSNPNSTHIVAIDANTIRVYWQVRFEDSYKYKIDGSLFTDIINNNLYSAALRETIPGVWNSSSGSNTIGRSLAKFSQWGVNVQTPKVEIGNPNIINATDFSINWATTAYGLKTAEGYMWVKNQPLQVNKLSPTPTGLMTLPITEPNTNTKPVPNSNVNAYYRTGFASKLGIHSYRLTSTTEVTDIINTKMYVEDTACNYIVDSGNSLNLTGRWMMTARGSTFAPNFTFTVNQANIAPGPGSSEVSSDNFSYLNAFSFLSTYLTSALQKPIAANARTSKSNFLIEDYNDWNGTVPKTDSSTNWYDYLYKIVSSNTQVKSTGSTAMNTGTKTSQFLTQFGAGYTGNVVTTGNFTIQSNVICDTQTIFFINGNLSITPNFTLQNSGTKQNGCMFIVKGNVTVQNGSSNGYYDKIEAFFIVTGTFATLEDKSIITAQYDGLYIKGAVIANNTDLQRTFHLLKNTSYPAEIIEYDTRYSNIFQNALAIKEYSIREKDYLKKINK